MNISGEKILLAQEKPNANLEVGMCLMCFGTSREVKMTRMESKRVMAVGKSQGQPDYTGLCGSL